MMVWSFGNLDLSLNLERRNEALVLNIITIEISHTSQKSHKKTKFCQQSRKVKQLMFHFTLGGVGLSLLVHQMVKVDPCWWSKFWPGSLSNATAFVKTMTLLAIGHCLKALFCFNGHSITMKIHLTCLLDC